MSFSLSSHRDFYFFLFLNVHLTHIQTKTQLFLSVSPLRSHKSAPPCLRRCPACPARLCRRSRFRSSAAIARRGPSCPKWNTSQRSCISRTTPSSETDTRELTGCTVTSPSRRRTICNRRRQNETSHCLPPLS